MNDRSRATIAVIALVAVALVAWWWQTERSASDEPDAWSGGARRLALDDGSVAAPLGSDASAEPNAEPSVEPIDGLTAQRSGTPDGDGGTLTREQLPPDMSGEPRVVIEPEPTERPLPPDFVALDEAALRSRRRGQLGLIEERMEALSQQIDEARDRGGEDIVHVLQARRSQLEQRRDALRQLGP